MRSRRGARPRSGGLPTLQAGGNNRFPRRGTSASPSSGAPLLTWRTGTRSVTSPFRGGTMPRSSSSWCRARAAGQRCMGRGRGFAARDRRRGEGPGHSDRDLLRAERQRRGQPAVPTPVGRRDLRAGHYLKDVADRTAAPFADGRRRLQPRLGWSVVATMPPIPMAMGYPVRGRWTASTWTMTGPWLTCRARGPTRTTRTSSSRSTGCRSIGRPCTLFVFCPPVSAAETRLPSTGARPPVAAFARAPVVSRWHGRHHFHIGADRRRRQVACPKHEEGCSPVSFESADQLPGSTATRGRARGGDGRGRSMDQSRRSVFTFVLYGDRINPTNPEGTCSAQRVPPATPC